MRVQKQSQLHEICKLALALALLFFLLFLSMNLLPDVKAVTSSSGTNATITLFDDGDRDREALGSNKTPGTEINRLFNDTTNVYFYANYTNGTGQSMVPNIDTSCVIEFDIAAGGNRGPFTMNVNSSLNLFEYNRSFPRNGTFYWNATCSNSRAGTASLQVRDAVRIFGPGCTSLGTATFPQMITNNTILCGGIKNVDPAETVSVINIPNNNITLDCNGTIIREADDKGIGVSLNASNGTILLNCLFENFSTAIVKDFTSFSDDIFVYNNSFANSSFGVNLTRVGNLTLRSNNFTNLSSRALYLINITNGSATRNRFCQNGGSTYLSENANMTFTNNTLCVTLINPVNNTDQNDINFTFNVPSFGSLARTCDLIVGQNTVSGRVSVPAATETNVNVTLNTSAYNGDRSNWQVNCTDSNNNGDISIIFNTTYRACTIPASNLVSPTVNVTFCPGLFEVNLSDNTQFFMNISGVNDTIIECNRTIVRGNSQGDLFVVSNNANRVTVRSCIGANFSSAVKTITATNAANITFVNNSFVNMSNAGIIIGGSFFNITNNTIERINNAGIGVVGNGQNTIRNNSIRNVSIGIGISNSSNNTIIGNNVSLNRLQGIVIETDLATLRTALFPFENILINNTICGNTEEGLLVNNTRFTLSPLLDGLIANNTFCNGTNGQANRDIAKITWELQVLVVNSTNTSINDANINITNSFNTNVSSDLLTNATGGIVRGQNITQFIINNSLDIINYSPTKFVAAKNNEKTNQTNIINQTSGFSLSTHIILNLSQDAASPNVTQISPLTGTVNIALNLTAIVVDQSGIQSCSLFTGSSNTSTTNQGRMDYSVSDGVVNKTFSFATLGTYFAYANCSDNGNNLGFNMTTLTIAAAPSGNGGGESGSGSEGSSSSSSSASSSTAAAATAETEATEKETQTTETVETKSEVSSAAETAAQSEGGSESGGSGGESDDDEQTIKELEKGEIVALEYGLEIEKVTVNNEIIYENAEQQNTITVKDYDTLDVAVILKNINQGIVNDIEVVVGDLPIGVEVESIEPRSIDSLNTGEEIEILLHFVTTDVAETFVLEIEFHADKASAVLGLSTILEAGKGNYYTRQRVIEETKQVLVRTYKFLFLLFLIPILLLLRMTSMTDENAIRTLIKQKRINDFWRIYVSEAVYPKYNMYENIKPIEIGEENQKKVRELIEKEKISYELASLTVFANKKLIPRIFTQEEITKELRHKYPRILFTSPLRDFREDQLQRYVETQSKKGYSNNEIRDVLLNAGWKREVIKKYLDPEKDLDAYIIKQRQNRKSFWEIRKMLIDAKWDMKIVDKYVSKEMVLKEYIGVQRKKGVPNGEIRKQLIALGWEKVLVQKYLNPENDLKAYVVAQQQRGVSKEELSKKLLKKGWKKEIVDKYVRR